MKKFFAAVLAMTIGASAFAGPVTPVETLVYDYKASIKRIDAQYKIKSLDKIKVVTDTYAVKSDSLKGYLLVPACLECREDGVLDFNEDATGTLYVTRTGDKYAKKAGLKFVVKTNANVDAGVFGAFVRLNGPEGTNLIAPLKAFKDAKKAWMHLDYDLFGVYTLANNPMNIEEEDLTWRLLDSTFVLKNVAPIKGGLIYGFYGLDNTDPGVVLSTGFGSTKVVSHTEAGKLGWCDNKPGSSYTCQIINSISGSMIGNPKYQGACGTTPMWDLCYGSSVTVQGDNPDTDEVETEYKKYNDESEHQGVVCGTWTLKYNKKITEAADQFTAILKGLKASANDIIDVTAAVRP